MSTAEQLYGSIVTDLGVSAVFKATTEGKKVNIVSMGAGDGDGAYYAPTADMTALKKEVWRGAIGTYEVDPISKNMIHVRAVIPDNVGGFTVRELALFDDTGQMIAICNTPANEKVALATGIICTMDLTMSIVLTNAGTLTFVLDSSTITASAEDLSNHNKDVYAHPSIPRVYISKTQPNSMNFGDFWYQTEVDFEPEEEEATEIVDVFGRAVTQVVLMDEISTLNVVDIENPSEILGISQSENNNYVDATNPTTNIFDITR